MERLLFSWPAGEHMKMSTRKYCVGRREREPQNETGTYNAHVNLKFSSLLLCLFVHLCICQSPTSHMMASESNSFLVFIPFLFKNHCQTATHVKSI